MSEHEELRGHNKRRLSIVLAFSTLILVLEVVGGIWTKSLALLADAGHMLTDVGGLGMALLAMRFAERPATPERTYGYYRVEILAAAANASILFGISGFILYEAYERFRHPVPIQSGVMLGVACVGFVANLVGMFLLRGGSSKSLNMKGAYFEILSDLLSSVAVIVAALVIRFTGWTTIDPLLSAGIGLFILPRTWKLLWEAVGVLLEGTPAEVNLEALRQAIGTASGVTGVHDLHVWTLTSGMNAMSVHVTRAESAPHEAVLEAVRSRIASGFPIGHVTVQIESESCPISETHL